GGVQAHDVVARAHHRLPPLPADVLLELDAERAVVPRRAGAAVDLAAGVHESPALGEADDGVDEIGGHGALHPAGCRWGRYDAAVAPGSGQATWRPAGARRPALSRSARSPRTPSRRHGRAVAGA